MLADRVRSLGRPVLTLHEPGGTPLGEAIRTQLLSASAAPLDPMAELLLFEAARAQLVSQVIKPALESGVVVICDRFYDSTIAYQGYARGIDLARIEELNAIAVGDCHPDRTILIDVDVSVGLSRARRSTGRGGDRLEREGDAFHQAVHDGFDEIARKNPERIRVVGQFDGREATAEAIFAELSDLLVEGDES
jgi:dTMP kinase